MGILEVVCSHSFTTQTTPRTPFYGQTWICWFLFVEGDHDTHNCIMRQDDVIHKTMFSSWFCQFVISHPFIVALPCDAMCPTQTWTKQYNHHSMVGDSGLQRWTFKHNKLYTHKLIGKSLARRHQCPVQRYLLNVIIWGTKYILWSEYNRKILPRES